MKYKICIWAMGSHPEIEINQEEFEQLKYSGNCLSAALAIEEKYELLLTNYLDLEKECLNVAVDYMVKHLKGYEGFFDIRLGFNRKIVNLLTSTKLYVDQIQQHVKVCVADNNEIGNEVKSLFSTEYDSFFEYRFMEALRNYVQHRGLAVHSTTLGGRRINHSEDWESEDWELEYKTSVLTLKKEVENDSAFKKQVIQEMPEKIDLMNASRVYIESISKIHSEIRNIINENVDRSRSVISNFVDEYKEINEGNSNGLYAVCLEEKEPYDKVLEKIPLGLEWDDIRLALVKSNKNLINLKKRYVSGSTYDGA